ncbi:metalloregulator ArsR/SmtB family transcription factor [Mycobacterium sp. 1423905.2]|uniref:helix-turn-helix transcriptional regulator n=1 Tax=Mycobacterium sp. 1423905.2 TaxID=1856859 RepID=UPI0012E9E5EF|nr:helix-turn-helix domain-containing protein [Mycobacterium sp. 1423905.2]
MSGTPASDSGGRRRAVLRALRTSRVPLGIVAIADELGVHPNTVRFHLDSLVSAGQVERVQPAQRGPGRPPAMFRAVRQMDRGGTRSYRVLAEVLTASLAAQQDSATMALNAGRAWGSGLHSPPGDAAHTDAAIAQLVAVLDGLGFAPESDREDRIGLRHCPFLELAEIRPHIVCSIHLGLMQGALDQWAAPVTVERLDAFAEPDLCLAHLTPAGAAK